MPPSAVLLNCSNKDGYRTESGDRTEIRGMVVEECTEHSEEVREKCV